MAKAVEFVNINKRFPGVHVLKDISFSVEEGEVHALLGENGAGKSTLLNILHGVYPEYEGEVRLHGEKVSFKDTNDAIVNGKISKVHQETLVVKDLTVGQNVTMGYEPKKGIFIDFKKMNKDVDVILEDLNCNFKSSDLVATLTAGEMQMLAIARALYHHSTIISLDEPTASITLKETEALFDVVRKLKKQGVTILYVSHRLEEIFQICDRASILRDGEYIQTMDIANTTRDELIHAMVGRNVSAVASRLKPSPKTDEVVLSVEHLTNENYNDVSFELHKGEILGFSGLMGAGRTETARALFGADPKQSGKISIMDKSGQLREVTINSPQDAVKYGIGYLSEDRRRYGCVVQKSVTENTTLATMEEFTSGIFINKSKEKEVSERYVKELATKTPNCEQLVVNLSGGNQQKVVIAKWLTRDSEILIFDEPTRGIDVGAKNEIYKLMNRLAAEGKSIIMISSEMTEVLRMSDRIIVMCEGKITGNIDISEATQEHIMNHATRNIN